MSTIINEANFGAWLIKCDPENVFDLQSSLEDGDDIVTGWSVRGGSRADLMQKGDPIVFWVSGTGQVFERGIWGVGYVTGPVEEANPDDVKSADVGYWLDLEARRAVEFFVPCHIPLKEEPLFSDTDLRSNGIDDLEVQRMPGGSNPSWLTKDQQERLNSLLPWSGDDDPGEVVTVSRDDAGFGDPKRNAIVEAAAMAAVVEFYGDEWEYEDVTDQKCGWDLTFFHRTESLICKVEVKGVSSPTPTVLLTANELGAAKAYDDEWYLAVVTRALSDPNVIEYAAAEALAAAQPYVYKAVMPTE